MHFRYVEARCHILTRVSSTIGHRFIAQVDGYQPERAYAVDAWPVGFSRFIRQFGYLTKHLEDLFLPTNN